MCIRNCIQKLGFCFNHPQKGIFGAYKWAAVHSLPHIFSQKANSAAQKKIASHMLSHTRCNPFSMFSLSFQRRPVFL